MLFQGVSWLVKNSWGVSEQSAESYRLRTTGGQRTLLSSHGEAHQVVCCFRLEPETKVLRIFSRNAPPSTLNKGILFMSVCRALPYKAQCDLKEYGIPHDPAAKICVEMDG